MAAEPSGWLSRLSPLVKLGWLVALSVALFAVPVAFVLGCCAVAGAALVGRPVRHARGLRRLLVVALVLFGVQALFFQEGSIVLQLPPLAVTDGGLRQGALVGGRFLAVILLSYLYVGTTEPNDLAYALMRAGLPYRYGFALVVALRLLPTVELDAGTVYQAQLARGVRYDAVGPRRIFTLARQLLFPLLVTTLGRMDSLAISMEGRSFGRSPRRTFWREPRRSRADRPALVLLAVFVVAVALAPRGVALP